MQNNIIYYHISFHYYILTHQNKTINNTWGCISMLKHFKTKIMAFKLTKEFKECITNIISKKRDKIKGKEVCSLSSTPSSNFEGLLCKKNVDSFSRFFASFPLIFRFSNWSRFPFLFLKTQSLSPLLQFYSKYFIDFHVFLFFSLWFFSSGSSFSLWFLFIL